MGGHGGCLCGNNCAYMMILCGVMHSNRGVRCTKIGLLAVHNGWRAASDARVIAADPFRIAIVVIKNEI